MAAVHPAGLPAHPSLPRCVLLRLSRALAPVAPTPSVLDGRPACGGWGLVAVIFPLICQHGRRAGDGVPVGTSVAFLSPDERKTQHLGCCRRRGQGWREDSLHSPRSGLETVGKRSGLRQVSLGPGQLGPWDRHPHPGPAVLPQLSGSCLPPRSSCSFADVLMPI